MKETKKKLSKVTEKYASRKKKKGDSVKVAPIDLSSNTIYNVLEDSTIPFEERRQKLVEMMTVNLASHKDVEVSQTHIKMVKDIVKELLNRFTAHNRKSIEFTRDNPMHNLKESMQEVFDNYHAITVGRSDLKNKLSSVDSLIEDLGGEEKLVVALVEAKTRSTDAENMEQTLIDTKLLAENTTTLSTVIG